MVDITWLILYKSELMIDLPFFPRPLPATTSPAAPTFPYHPLLLPPTLPLPPFTYYPASPATPSPVTPAFLTQPPLPGPPLPL